MLYGILHSKIKICTFNVSICERKKELKWKNHVGRNLAVILPKRSEVKPEPQQGKAEHAHSDGRGQFARSATPRSKDVVMLVFEFVQSRR